jgi:phage gpG-like protein
MIQMQWDMTRLEYRLGGLFSALRDLRPVWADVHTIFLQFMKAVFDREGKYGGAAWEPLNPRYAAWKRRHYGEQPILQLTGALYRSLTDEQDPAHVYRTGPAFMETGSSLRYARAHQWGYPPGHLPARPIIREFTKAEGARVADAVLAHLLRGAQRGRA